MARITWQNVDAPNFDDALRATALGSESFQTGMDSIARLAQGAHGRKKSAANNAAMEKMLSFQDVGSWDNALKTQGLGALGISSDMASEDLINAVAGRRNELEGDRATDFDYGQAAYRQDRQVISDGRSDLAWNRGEEDRARGLEAQSIADKLANSSLSPEEAAMAIRDQKLEPRLEAAALASLSGADPVHWQVGADTRITDQGTVDGLAQSRTHIDSQNRQLQYDLANDKPLQLWIDSPSRYQGYDSPLQGVLEGVGAKVSDEDAEAFGKSKGWVTDEFNSLKKAFPDVPEEIVASVMQNNLESNGWLWRGDKQDFDKSAIREQLTQFQDPDLRADLELKGQAHAKKVEDLSAAGSKLDRLENQLLVAIDKGASPEVQNRLRESIAEVTQSFATLQEEVAEVEGGAGPAARGFGSDLTSDRWSQIEGQRQAAASAITGAAGREGVDPRIANSRDAVGGALSAIGYGADRVAGNLAAGAGQFYNMAHRGVGYGVGLVAPETGSAMLDWADRNDARMAGLAQEGLVPNGPAAAAPASASAAPAAPAMRGREADAIVAQASYAPGDTLQLVGAEANLPPADVEAATQALSLMGDDGVPAPVKKQARAQIQAFITKARASGGSSPEVQALIERAEEWLRL